MLGERILITSGKGGTGKSSTAAGLAVQLAAQGCSVLLIDLDAGLRCLDLLLGISAEVVFDLQDVMSGNAALQAAVCCPAGTQGLSVLAAPLRRVAWDAAALAKLTEAAVRDKDFVLLDCPAGFDDGFAAGAGAVDNALIVATTDPVGIRDAGHARMALAPFGLPIRLVINKLDRRQNGTELLPLLDDVIDAVGAQLLGIVPQDFKIPLFGSRGRPLTEGRGYKAMVRIAGRLAGQPIPLPPIGKI